MAEPKAAGIAAAGAEGAPPVAMMKLVCFYLHGQEYGASITAVKETMAVPPITRVFLTPPWLAGIINLRGDVVAVIDLARFLGMPPPVVGDDSRILVARPTVDGEARAAGLLVDAIAELRTVEAAAVQAPPPTLSAEAAGIFAGIVAVGGGRALRVLDLVSLFQSDSVRAFQRGGT